MFKILVADDELALLDMISEALTLNGYEVFRAIDGEEAFQLTLDKKPDLVLLDINMPRFTGIESFNMIRDNAEIAHIPVLILSGYSNEELKDMCPRADGIIQKPFSIEYLYACIDDILTKEKRI